MKLSYLLLSSLLLLPNFGCKREDGPLSPEADSPRKPAVGTPGTDNVDPNTGTTEPPTGGGQVTLPNTPEPIIPGGTEVPRRMPLVDDSWAHAAAATLQSYYNPQTSLYRDTWDVSAHSLGSLIDFMKLSGSREYLYVVNKVFEANKANNFITDNHFSNYLWASTWIRAYDLIGDKRYLEMAKTIADDMDSTAWDASSCGGGIVTSRTVSTKLAANTLAYIQLNGALHNRSESGTTYLERAGKGWLWFMTSGMFNGASLVNNGQTLLCKNDGSRTWTHSQGLLIAAAMEMYKAAGKSEYLDIGKRVATAVMSSLVSEGVLREANDKTCGTCMDERIYKGIFMRSLREAQADLADPTIEKFFEGNIVKVWTGSRSTSDAIGFHWQGAFDGADAGRQSAALDLLNASLFSNDFKNVALNRVGHTTVNCAANEAGAQALDGSTSTKWCSAVSPSSGASLIIDLGSVAEIQKIKILHGAAGGENLDTNTRNFTLSVGTTSAGPWTEVAKAEDNTSTATFHKMTDLSSQFIRLHVSKGGADGIARIYEVVVE